MAERGEAEFRALVEGPHSVVEPVETTGGSGAMVSTGSTTGGWNDDPTWFERVRERIPPRLLRHARWAAPTAVMGIAAGTRLIGLGHPGELVFDETYYVKDAWALWNLGYESQWPGDANEQWKQGVVDGWTGDPSFAVHPPLGKWIIGLFEWLGGPEHPWSWRLGTAIAGILLVAAIMFAAWLLTKSIPLASLAGLLLAIDGNGIVMSRVGLLDGFLALFALLGFIGVLLDRERTVRTGALWWRPWLLAAAIALGAATAVKWNGMWFLAAFGLYSVLADPLTRRSTAAFIQRAAVNLLLLVPLALAVYLVTWTGWFVSDNGYQRHWADNEANAWTGAFAWVPRPIQSWLHLEQITYSYHIGEHRPHDYMAPAWTWLLLIRPTSMWYQSSALGDPGCEVQQCGASILDIANPLIWWASVVAAVYLLVRFVRRPDRRGGAVLIAIAGGYLPWLAYWDRTIFQFYTIAFEPYLLLALVLAIPAVAGSREDESRRRAAGQWTIAGFLLLAVAIAVYFWPLYTGQQAPYLFIASHWWLPGWR